MKHSIKELYKINGAKFYTEDYLAKYDIPKAKSYALEAGWSVARYLSPNTDEFRIYTVEGVKIGYAYGEKTWFDTREERDAYRAEQKIAREASGRKNKVIKKITEKLKTMSEEELVNLLKTL